MLEEESMEGPHRRVGDVEEEGGIKISMPTMNNDNGDQALLGFEGRVVGPTIACLPSCRPHSHRHHQRPGSHGCCHHKSVDPLNDL